MQRGGLTSTIPTEIGRLTNLRVLDLDLTISLEILYRVAQSQPPDTVGCQQHRLGGSINGIGNFPDKWHGYS
jgi:hypothetical protein